MNESSAGPERCRTEELAANRADNLANARAREMDDGWYRNQSPDWSKVVSPFLSAANWAGFGLHPRGNFEAFTQAAAKEKWLEGTPGTPRRMVLPAVRHGAAEALLRLLPQGRAERLGQGAAGLANLRRPFSKEFELRKENAVAARGTKWTKLFLDASPAASIGVPPAARVGDVRREQRRRHMDVAAARARDRDHRPDGAEALRVFVDRRRRPVRHRAGVSPDGREVDFQGTSIRTRRWRRAGFARRIANSTRRSRCPIGPTTATTTSAAHSGPGLRTRRGGLADVHRAAGWLPHCREHLGPDFERPGDDDPKLPFPRAWLGAVDAR